MGSLFTASIYRALVDPRALAAAEAICEVLDFEVDFVAGDRSRVAPVLARHDLLVEYDRQRAAYRAIDPARDPQPLVTLERGHVTGALAYRSLREHLLAALVSDRPGPNGPAPR
jgi:hypothetical protein